MTRDELREKVAQSICNDWGYLWDGDPDDVQVISENDEPYDDRPSRKIFRLAADGVLDIIFAALKEPTDEMNDKARHLMSWLDGYELPTYKNLITHCRLLGKTKPNDCLDINHVPPKAQRTSWIFQAMISASPLAPSKEEK